MRSRFQGNGAVDLALLGERPEDGRLEVIVEDAMRGKRLGLLSFEAAP